MTRQISINRRCLFASLCLLSGLAVANFATAADDGNLEVHEWSVWFGEPQGKQFNASADFPTAMPGLVDSERSRRREADKPKPSPISLMTLYGTPPDVVDIDLRVTAGRPISQWPRSEAKSNRLRWLDLTLTKELSNPELLAYIPDTHWFNQARKLEGLYIQLKKGGRAERFFAYDLELNAALNVRLDGGPDQFKVANLGKHALLDVFLIVPGPDGPRVGWLDTVTASAGGAAAGAGGANPASAPAGQPQAGVQAARVVVNGVAVQVAIAAPVANPGAAPVAAVPATPNAQPGVAPAGAKPGDRKETVTDIPLSEPLKPDSDEFQQKTTGELRKRLSTTGLKPAEIDLLVSMYAPFFFSTDEIHMVYRLSQEGIDELTPLTVEPETAKVKRVALVMARKVDPKLREDVQKLIQELADTSYKKREQAEKRLIELGSLATANLKEALKTKDLEVVMRAERILLNQKEQLGNETPAEQ